MSEFTITTDWLRARTRATPRAIALRVDGETFSFADLDALVDRLCGFLAQQGARPGEHVGMLMPNSPAAVCCVFAAARLGAVLVPLNGRLTPGELAWQLERADCARLVCLAGVADAAEAAAGGRLPIHVVPDGAAAFTAWAGKQPPLADDAAAPAPLSGTQAIVFTSGTTGFPKGAMITFANHFWSATASAFKLGVRPDERWLACLPLCHVGGLAILFRSCLYGTCVVLHHGFDMQAVLASLRDEAITIVSLVPTMLARLLNAGLNGLAAPALRLILLGGAAAPPELLARADDAGLPVAVTYGLTEACSQVATLLPEEARRKPGSPGRPLLFTEIRILDEDGAPVPAGAIGQIAVAGPTVMTGYYGDIEASAAAVVDGRLHTGDMGYLDHDGDLWVVDRRSDLIVSGGENVYPAEVEAVLRAHPAVAAASVVGLPHSDWGQQVAAMIVLHPSAALTAEELLAYSRRRLAGYKQPRVVAFAAELPMTTSGKVQRREVARLLEGQLETL